MTEHTYRMASLIRRAADELSADIDGELETSHLKFLDAIVGVAMNRQWLAEDEYLRTGASFWARIARAFETIVEVADMLICEDYPGTPQAACNEIIAMCDEITDELKEWTAKEAGESDAPSSDHSGGRDG